MSDTSLERLENLLWYGEYYSSSTHIPLKAEENEEKP